MYLDGYNPTAIGDVLKKEGITDARGRQRPFNYTSINYILTNEKYSGDLLLQKYYSTDFLNKKKEINDGRAPQYYVENSHDPIVPKEIFNQVQAERKRRDGMVLQRKNKLSGKIFCGECGSQYYRFDLPEGGVYWRCGAGWRDPYKDVTCIDRSNNIIEEELQRCSAEAFNLLPNDYDDMIRLQERLKWVTMAEIERKIMEQKEPDEELLNQKAEVAERQMEIRNLIRRTQFIMGRDAWVEDEDVACEDPERFFRITGANYDIGPVRSYDETEVSLFIDRIIVHPETLEVRFKGGVVETVPWRRLNYKKAKEIGLIEE